jgi:hypothetical protein
MSKPRDWISTGEAAKILMMSKNVLRATYYGKGAVCGLVPEKDANGWHLKWDKFEVIKASIRRQADCTVMLRALEGVTDWLGEQRIQTDDPRIEFAYEVLQELEGKY